MLQINLQDVIRKRRLLTSENRVFVIVSTCLTFGMRRLHNTRYSIHIKMTHTMWLLKRMLDGGQHRIRRNMWYCSKQYNVTVVCLFRLQNDFVTSFITHTKCYKCRQIMKAHTLGDTRLTRIEHFRK